jgi:hypothetical protein
VAAEHAARAHRPEWGQQFEAVVDESLTHLKADAGEGFDLEVDRASLRCWA